MNGEDNLDLLEFQELDELSGPEFLTEQLALYLLRGDLCDAKFLWKRIPKQNRESPELSAVWLVGQALWLRNMAEFYKQAHSFTWSERIECIIARLIAVVQEKMVRLIGTAYTSIRPEDAATLLGITLPELESVILEKEWTVVDGLIHPRDPSPEEANVATGESQIEKLTNFVSVLEN